ncbi:NAD(P)-binding protein [Exidia glandulosa HHB12029]|uniref:NAD(P)-binding protein n=1 Tax=Exidia glandulosa HHB12029 TaxID=1314781 RepID=A0A165DRM8_EXIGL|nr:NAD(P)-binding protein [Exidia glandulosa HHB12029]
MSGIIFLTGASRGIGLAIAIELLKSGQRVATFARTTSPELAALQSQYPDTLFTVNGDIADPASSTSALKKSLEHFKTTSIAALVLNAGVQAISVVARASLDDWKRAFDVNFFSALPIVQAALPGLKEGGGRIVLVSASAAVMPIQGMAGYSASKAALNAFAATLAVEEPSIPVVAVDPGLVATSMAMEAGIKGKDHFAPDMLAFAAKASESGLVLKPDAPGRVISWFALNASKEVSGKYLSWADAAKIAGV